MCREIITSNGCIMGENYDVLIQKGIIRESGDSITHKKWNAMLKEAGLYDPDANVDARDLFALLKCAFDIEYRTIRDVCFHTGYVYSTDYKNSIKHCDSSRAYSTPKTLYIDELLVSVLFEYIAVYYLWTTNKDNPELYGFCFQKALRLLDGCYRKGNLDSDEGKSEIIDMINQYCGNNAVIVISDLYWSALAFAICHELAHIYHEHNGIECDDKSENWEIEYTADKCGCEMILNLIDKKYSEISSPFHEVFQQYTYTAPEILFLFYEDLFYVGQWLHGEQPGDSHPDFRSRIDRMLEQSISPKYSLDTKEGNAILAAYWEISDLFREEFFLKLKNGKLEIIKRKGENTTMSGNGYEEAYAYDHAMCVIIRQIAKNEQVSEGKAVGLWDLAIQIDVTGTFAGRDLIWKTGDQVYSTKAINVIYNQKNALEAIVEMGVSISLPQDKLSTIRFLILILFQLYKISTVELSQDMAKILIECHKRNAYKNGIDEDKLLAAAGVEVDALNMLYRIKSIRIEDGKLFLNEKVLIGDTNNF